MKALYIPSITGQFSHWRYYQMIMSVENIVEELPYLSTDIKYRVKTTDEVDEINSAAVNEMLQRLFDERRLQPIKNYLLQQSDKYVNNLTIAVYGGDPEWLPIGLKALHDLEGYSEEQIEEVEKTFGIIKLRGDEIMFVLDGQHRVKGLREAVKENPDILKEQIAITLIAHNPDDAGKERTRRLFTTINRYAKPVSLGESILLDEDDVSAIITRYLINDHPLLSKNNVVAQNKTAELKFPTDNDKITTTICLYNINEIFIPKSIYPPYEGAQSNLVRVRPSNEAVLNEYKSKIFKYWDLFFKLFKDAHDFINNPQGFRDNVGNLFFLRPIGQEVIFNLIFELEQLGKLNEKIDSIKKVEPQLNSNFWNYILYDPYKQRMLVNKSLAKHYLRYHFGLYLSAMQLKSLKNNYKKNSGDLQLELPSPAFAE